MIENIENRDIKSFDYEEYGISDGEVTGICELGKCFIELFNKNNKYSHIKETWIKTKFGEMYVYDSEPNQADETIKLSCYDARYKLDKEYDKSLYSFPMKLRAYRNAVFNDSGLDYSDEDEFPNEDLIIPSAPYIGENPKNRDAMKVILQAGLSILLKSYEDVFSFGWFDDNDEYELKDCVDLTTDSKETKAINLMILGRGTVEDNVYWPTNRPTEEHQFRIDNNYILDDQGADDIRYNTIRPLYERINGFKYVIYDLRTTFVENKLNIKLGSKIKFYNRNKETVKSYVMNKKITYIGGNINLDKNYEISLSASAISETGTEVKYGTSLKNDILRVERKADKNAGEISDLIKKTSDTSENVTKIEQTVDSITTTVSSITFEVDNTIKSIFKQYKIKDSTDDWSETYPIRQEGQVILAREKYIHTDESITYGTEYEITGDKGDTGATGSQGEKGPQGEKGDKGDQGEQGIQGIQGPAGADGTSTYFYVRYSANSSGNPMTTSPNENTQYMGVASTTSNTAPASYLDYTWSKTKGNTGEQGTPGATGADGKTSYLHIKYSADGTTFTPADDEYEEGEKPSAYIGQYIDFIATDSKTFSDYTWYKFTEDIDGTLNSIQNDVNNLDTTVNNNYQEIQNKFDEYTPLEKTVTLENSLTTLQTDTYTKTEVNTKLTDGSVTKVSSTSGTFDTNGLTIEQTNAKTKGNFNATGLKIIDNTSSSGETLLFAGYDETRNETVVETANINVSHYLTIGTKSRFEDYEDGTGVFDI